MNNHPTDGLDRKGLTWFLILAFGISWALALPLWLSGQGLQHPLAFMNLIAFMMGPAIATFVVVRWISRPQNVRRTTGLRFGAKGSRWGLYWLFAWVGLPLFILAAPFVGALLGLYPLDIVEFSGFREVLEQAGAAATLDLLPIQILVAVQLAQAILISPLVNGAFTFGEEWGWRGYLLPKLLPLGQWPALIVSGAIWGLWHAPIIALGYNYPTNPTLGVFLMVIFCVIFGIILGWTRLATGSVWPAVIGHGALNGLAAMSLLMHRAGTEIDPAVVGITGWTGWILPVLFIVLLVVTRQLPVRNPPDLREPEEDSPAMMEPRQVAAT
jgi:uncharacterized protein